MPNKNNDMKLSMRVTYHQFQEITLCVYKINYLCLINDYRDLPKKYLPYGGERQKCQIAGSLNVELLIPIVLGNQMRGFAISMNVLQNQCNCKTPMYLKNFKPSII